MFFSSVRTDSESFQSHGYEKYPSRWLWTILAPQRYASTALIGPVSSQFESIAHSSVAFRRYGMSSGVTWRMMWQFATLSIIASTCGGPSPTNVYCFSGWSIAWTTTFSTPLWGKRRPWYIVVFGVRLQPRCGNRSG